MKSIPYLALTLSVSLHNQSFLCLHIRLIAIVRFIEFSTKKGWKDGTFPALMDIILFINWLVAQTIIHATDYLYCFIFDNIPVRLINRQINQLFHYLFGQTCVCTYNCLSVARYSHLFVSEIFFRFSTGVVFERNMWKTAYFSGFPAHGVGWHFIGSVCHCLIYQFIGNIYLILRRIFKYDYSNDKNRYISDSKTGLKDRKSHFNRLKANRTNVQFALAQISFARANYQFNLANRKNHSG
jgi:hypothetical protein